MAAGAALKNKIVQQKMGAAALGTLLGDIIFVDSVNGSNGNDGLSPRHAVATLVHALTLAAAGDTIILNRGGSETVTATVAVNLARIKIICPVADPRSGYKISAAGTIDIATVSAADVHIEGVAFAHTGATANASCILTTAAADRLVVDKCLFDDSAVTTTFTGTGVEITDDTVDVTVRDSLFLDCDNGVEFVIATGKNCDRPLLTGNTYHVGRAASFGIASALTGTGTVRGARIIGETFIEANGSGAAAAVAWDGTDGTDATVGPIKLEAAVDQGLVAGCKAFTALAQTFDTLNAIAAGAAVDQVDNSTGEGGDFETLLKVPTADATTDVYVRDAVGRKTDAAVQDKGTTKSIMAYVKGICDGLYDAAGIATWDAAALPANGVSIAEAIRYLNEKQVPRIVSKAIADMSTGFGTADSPVTMFTVTGDVMCRVFGVVGGTALTSVSSTGTLAVGTTESTGGLIAASTVNGTQFAATDVWVDTSPANDVEQLTSDWFIIGGGADIIMTIATNNITAGALTMYCQFIPLDSTGAVVAA